MKYQFTDNFMQSKENWEFLKQTMMGPNALRVSEELASCLDIRDDMRILDLGCGMGLSSIFLAKKYKATVFAADLWITPTDNHERFVRLGLDRQIIPVSVDVTKGLPFAHDYFDILFSVDSYHYYGNNENMLPFLVPFVKKGGYIVVAVPGFKKEFINGLPPKALEPFWQPDWNFYTTAWWRQLWEKCEAVQVIECKEMQAHEKAWAEWLQSPNPYAQGDIEMMKAENGEYFNLIQLVAKVK